MTRNTLRIRNGFLTTGPTLDSLPTRHHRNQEEDPDAIEIHNHIPVNEESVIATYDPRRPEPFQDMTDDDEEPEGQGEVVARFPANGFTCQTEGDEIVIYRGSGSPPHKTDIFDMTTRDSRSRRPRTLRELNALHAAHYRQKAGRR
jgi:hypothetical protein